ncbi:MAG: sugar ABC transporter substrate-binding protein [Lachnospiraceae bacterium]|nr:sugar ABC transporter substrate-binding protein [Lachnospiraceae bacterium]
MKKKVLSMVLAASMIASMLVGCGQTTQTTEATATETTEAAVTESSDVQETAEEVVTETADAVKTINGDELTKIGLSVAAMDNEFTTNLADTLQAAADEYGVEVVVAQADQTTAKQVEQIENMVISGCQAICVIPVDLTGILDALKSAKEKGVVISMCGCIPESKDYYDVVANVEQLDLGQSAAKAAAEWIDATFPDAEDGSIEVGILALNNTEEAIKREQGLEEIEKLTSKAKVVEVYDSTGASSIPTKAQEYTEMMLVSHPDVKCILAYSDFMGLPADEVIMRTPNIDKSQFGIFGCDYSSAGCEAIQKSINDESTYRGSGAFGVEFGKVMFDTVVGAVDVDDLGVYYEPTFDIKASNVADYIK